MKVKVESEKVGLKLNIQKTNIMASGPITSWEIDGETVSDFIFLGSKITTDGDCSHEITLMLHTFIHKQACPLVRFFRSVSWEFKLLISSVQGLTLGVAGLIHLLRLKP